MYGKLNDRAEWAFPLLLACAGVCPATAGIFPCTPRVHKKRRLGVISKTPLSLRFMILSPISVIVKHFLIHYQNLFFLCKFMKKHPGQPDPFIQSFFHFFIVNRQNLFYCIYIRILCINEAVSGSEHLRKTL